MRRALLRASHSAVSAGLALLAATSVTVAQSPDARAVFGPSEHVQDTGVVRGVITDAVTGQPLAAAHVRIPELHREELSHEDGDFALFRVPAGRYTLSVQRIGYAMESRSIQVIGGEEVTVRIAMRPTAVQLTRVVVTGTVSARSIEETIQPTNVVSQEELDRKLGTTVGATLRDEPGIAIVSMGPATARPVIRGLGGDRIILLEDGARSGDLSAASADHSVAIDPLTATQVEVVRGPATLLYGSNALGGVVNVIRREIPTSLVDQPHGTVSVQGQSVNSGFSAGGLVNARSDDVALRFEGSVRNAGDMRTPIGRMTNSDLRTYSAGGGFGYVEEWGHFGAAGRYYRSRYGIPPDAAGGHPEGVDIQVERWVGRGEVERHWAEGRLSSAQLDATYTRYHHVELESDGVLGTEFGLLTSQGDALVRHRAVGPFDEGAFGFRAQWRDYAAAGSQGNPPTRDYVLAGFALEELGAGAARIQIGARYDWHYIAPREPGLTPIGEVRSRTFGSLSGSIGGLYDFGGGVRMGVSLGRAFRAPDITELFSEGPHLAIYRDERGNPELESEVGLGSDIFLRVSRDRLQAEVAVFRNQIDRFIYARNTGEPSPRDPSIDVYEYTGGDALLTGAEGQIVWNVRGPLVVEATVSQVRGTLRTTGEPLPQMPPINGRLELRAERPGWFGGVGMRAAARQDRVGEFEDPTDGYQVFDGTAGVRWVARNHFHTLTLRVDNVLDREYREHLSALRAIMPEAGRGVSLLYRLSF
ncbi:MAG TPA: TonB-dependent receptor [Gemmatimonadaceae bacterium]|nr:TonB-dependent receptor [Gemmatimonadaceae bacterium]